MHRRLLAEGVGRGTPGESEATSKDEDDEDDEEEQREA